MYASAWVILFLPILGALLSFVAETPRRAAHVCMAALGGTVIVGLIVLGYRLVHEVASPIPDLSTLTFLSVGPDPSETTVFPSTFQVAVGVRVDNLSATFMVLIPFVLLLVQALGTSMLQRDTGYRRFFWSSSLLCSAMIGLVAAPGLFQSWLSLGLMSAATLVLCLHWWHRPETIGPARRAFFTLLGGDVALLLALVFTVYKLGSFIATQTLPAGQSTPFVFDFRLLDPAWHAAAQGTVAHVGYRSLAILAALLAFAGLVRAAQIPFTGWLAGLQEAPLPVLGAVSLSLLGGVLLLARVYTLLMVTPHVLSVIAVIGAAGALVLSWVCLFSRDIYRIALLSAAAQLALSIAALGAGGYSTGLLIAFVSVPLSLLLLVVAGSLSRSYRSRDIRHLGGAWKRMPKTSIALGIWALAASGLDLVGYDTISTVFLNRFPNGGHMAGWVRGLVAGLAIAALVLTALFAARLVVRVCGGTPAVRRGFLVERIVEAERPLRRLQAWSGVALLATVLVGLPGIGAFGRGRGRVPALTFSHWIYYGASHQALPVDAWAFATSAAVLVAGLGGAILLGRLSGARWWARLRVPDPIAGPRATLLRGWALGGRALTALAGETTAIDHGLIEPLFDALGEGLETTAWSLGRLGARRLRLGLGLTLAVALLLVGASVLAAGGHFPVHNT